LLGIIIILAMGTFSIFSVLKQKQDAITSISNTTEQLSQTIEKILRFSMLKNRRDEITLAVNNIIGTEGIKSARILNHEGIIKYSSRTFELNKNISQNNPLCISCHNKNDSRSDVDIKKYNQYRIDEANNLIFNSLPIYNDQSCSSGICHSTNDQPLRINGENIEANLTGATIHDPSKKILGFIEIEVSIKKLTSKLDNTRLQLILLTVLFSLLASGITYFSIRRVVGKPVKNLVDGTKRVAQGDFNHEIPPGSAELGLLADSFNRMQKQLLNTQTQLIESEKLASVGKLADEIANEINNPLTGIIIYSENLIEGLTDEIFKNDSEIICREALKIRESIRNILSLTRHEKPEFKISDINEIISNAISVVKKFSSFRNIKIINSISDRLPALRLDSGLMEQVFLNLLLISSETMLTGGILNISVRHFEDKKEIEINFNDTGKGIPEIVLKKVFDQNQSYDLKDFEKTGISLAVCKDIIEMHRGRINIVSALNGNDVTILLPV
jgi:two-component system NtrC family sensor kinase